MNYLSFENISKSYGDKTLFTKLSFGISKGEKTALIAVNGAGKTTLMRL
ncbi:MAG: ATP-binding cassette domain-containing protein, partial [Bacteroidales bacterium]|nr:ATP-binding cassette domain-containing protein [Bacteroidales bacterium]